MKDHEINPMTHQLGNKQLRNNQKRYYGTVENDVGGFKW